MIHNFLILMFFHLSRDVNIDACLGEGYFNQAYVFCITLKVILPISAICNATLFFYYRSWPTARHSQWGFVPRYSRSTEVLLQKEIH